MIGSTNAGSAIKTTLVVTVTDSSSSGYQTGRTVTITNGTNTQTGTTDSSGQVTFNLKSIGTYTISSDAPSGATASTATVVAEIGGSYTASITISVTSITVTVTDASSSGYQSGRTISATNGTETVTGTTDSSGQVTLHLTGSGSYTVTCTDVPSGGSANTVTVSVSVGGSYSAAITLTFAWIFSMTFNATTFQTDPTGCLVYGDDLVGKTPIANANTSLGRASNYTSSFWCWSDDGTSSNPLLKDCFFATFNSSGVLHEKLNPNDLTKKIATWNNSTKVWESASGSSSITSEDTMFCIPTVYSARSSSKLLLSDDSSKGTAYAHTIGGHVYDYLAIGVYLSSDDGSKCWSKSGVQAKGSQTRANFRSHSTAKTVSGGYAMVWNYHQWALMRDLVLFTIKSFDGQRKIGQGGHSYSTRTPGGCNTISPIAGDVSGTSNHVMCYIENMWGCQYQFIDDFYGNSGTYYVGQNAVPTDNTSNKTSITGFAAQGFATGILTGDISWGLGTNSSGDNSKGLCDYQYYSTSSDRLGGVGGVSGYVSDGYAGPSYLSAADALSYSYGSFGARLAFVFDL
ncbi:carboxypeptidase-like regulatory domain-containing protein [Methanomassiliicoccales archaeon LGM-RCC1]|nr:carboxypeptidase-like regulatory domain-containing protein [Methanomassiliicoccales archaeon LGM-RCC1]